MGLDDELARITERQNAVNKIIDAPPSSKIIVIIARKAEEDAEFLEYMEEIKQQHPDAYVGTELTYEYYGMGDMTNGEAAHIAAMYIAHQTDPDYDDEETI